MVQLDLHLIGEGSDPSREAVLQLEEASVVFDSITALEKLFVVKLEPVPGLEAAHLLTAQHLCTDI